MRCALCYGNTGQALYPEQENVLKHRRPHTRNLINTKGMTRQFRVLTMLLVPVIASLLLLATAALRPKLRMPTRLKVRLPALAPPFPTLKK